ncbi:Predicted exonuclease of the beta-lactamase fold involved in RNA processing [Prochlorococcus marinus str. MIT 9215]|uniref:Predicted exonuclease of the beta-lactamase fold involved in RNA processing n=1 Tax=Prochlorococcus marinus (strain MIT 9215) TaxID=93060 RepID=A8G4A2_PROM2|nr:ligase-associated DNA damage response exonuclease [Prochlorococcus marinus]ABV50433.1 Predicted exonuclease of the beta-lactamase fold involved in RNA processing [Prochlorococcus marinus str. MIT 9215]
MTKKQEDLIRYKDGNLYCEPADIWIDPIKPVKRALITHAHFDHFTFGCEEYISTKETAKIIKERTGNKIKIKTFDYGEEFKINGIKISFHPSGHILGSSQIRFIFAEEKWLISGDFKLQQDETCKQFEIVKTDYLISECTFGLPIFKWDDTNKIANDISKWITNSPEKTSLLFCYSLGKAQRLLNEISKTNFKGKIYSHGSIYKLNNCYKELGIDIKDTIKIENKKMIDELKGNLILLPPSLGKGKYLKNFSNIQTAFASGWMSIRALRKRSGFDKGFVISDHADWDGILEAIKKSEAKNVFFHHGNSEALRKYLVEKELINVLFLGK